ncbi:hypothetical protein HanIR_Chr13g0657031 [Helianthus annuus]|nr:hypothetical protein HanIR_Chr13g0657031 [Helianthus annuus]
MPATKTNSFLHSALKTNQNRLCSVISGNDNLRMPWKNRKLFIAIIFTEV